MADDEFALRRDMAAAAQVQSLLDGPVGAAFDTLKAAYHEAWETSGPRDDEGRRNLHIAVTIIGKVRSHLDAIVANGRLAERQIAEITARPKRFGIV
jgi:hypothetical protein